ncbi:unnamed protein product, partial [Adineta steineri]
CWSVFVEDPVQMQIVHIPEDDRYRNILSLVEDKNNLKLTLYNAIYAKDNTRVLHEICKLIDEK